MGADSLLDINDLDVNTVEMDGVDPSDYPDFADIYVTYACWKNGTELLEHELDMLNNSYGHLLAEIAFESLLGN